MFPACKPWRTQKTARSGFCPQGVVGADRATLRLSAKMVFQTIHFQRLYRPFREQCGSPPRSLPRPAGRIKERFVYGNGFRA
ncbi:hypothetical protein B1F85_02120 [Pseudomonas syringae pv. actinidiae]|nr:hypothetical protein B1R35_02120 [Pseudomonas syringae pv. actinidiae]AQX68028.1 hypothetical protein B1F85_02120 [Pseudomonas syringae pv. actinidiae]